MMEFYLLSTLIISVFLFCVETLITIYFPYKNIKTKCIVNSIFCFVMLFSILSYTMYIGNLVMETSTIFTISSIISVLLSVLMYKDKMKHANDKDVITEELEKHKTIEEFINKTGKIIYTSDPLGPLNVYLGTLEDESEILLYSIDKMEINDIFEITSFEEGKFYCKKNK